MSYVTAATTQAASSDDEKEDRCHSHRTIDHHHLLLFTPPDPQLSESVHVHESIEKLLLAAQLPKAATSVSQEGEREGEG
jgi:hypothetical protein